MKKDAEIIGIWGRRGSGKSTRAKELIADRPRVIVIDPIGDYAGKGFKTVHTLPALFREIKNKWPQFRLILQIRPSEAMPIMVALADALFIVQKPYKSGKDRQKLTLVIEEMSRTYPNRRLTDEEQRILDLSNMGRHWGIEIIGCSQRLAQVHTDFRGNTSQDYFFPLSEARDYDAAAGKIGRDQIPVLRDLDTHEYLHFSAGTVTRGRNKCNFKN